jgi:hypothetical protein
VSWLTNAIGVTTEWTWMAIQWTTDNTFWTIYYLFKWIVIGSQATVEYFWDFIEWFYYFTIDAAIWLYESTIEFIKWSYETFVDFVQWWW